MKPIARLSAIYELLEELNFKDNRKPADDVFVNYCRTRRYIGAKDRQFLSFFFFDLLRYYHGISHACLMCDEKVTTQLLIYVYWFSLYHSFDELTDEPYGMELPDPSEKKRIQRIAGEFSKNKVVVPSWMLDLFEGDDAKDLIKSLHGESTVDIRINPLLTTREHAIRELRTIGIKAKASNLSPYGIRLEQRVPLQATDVWKNGLIEIQDEGAQIVSLLCDVQPSHTVLDYCAGAGGKTLLLAACMKNKGRIIATDKYLHRLEQGKKRYRRADVHNVQVKDLNDGKWWKRHTGAFDRVLIDVPCSGSGTWRRNPDLKLRFTHNDLEEILDVQQNILETSKVYVKKGGHLIYATCSVWKCENERQIETFLKNNPDFKLLNAQDKFEKLCSLEKSAITVSDSQMVQLTPLHHHVDGFFVAILLKSE